MTTLLYFILLIGVLVFIHELGHFLVAKGFDVKVLKFSVGFGPKIFGFRRGETEYAIGCLPIGGFVKMVGEDPSEVISPADEGRAFHHKPVWQRALVIAAGPFFNLVFPLFILFVFFAGKTETTPAIVGHTFAGKPAAEAGLIAGDQIIAIDNEEIHTWADMQRVISSRPGENIELKLKRGSTEISKSLRTESQLDRNPVGWESQVGRIGISPFFEISQIGLSFASSPAAKAGLRVGDIIRMVDGQEIERWPELRNAIAEKPTGSKITLTYVRPTESVSSFFDLHALKPGTATIEKLQPLENTDPLSVLGIVPAEMFIQRVEPESPAEKLGIKKGDRILTLDEKPVKHWDAFVVALDTTEDPAEEHRISWITPTGEKRHGNFRRKKITTIDEFKQERHSYIFGVANRMIRTQPPLIPIPNRWSFAAQESVRSLTQATGMIVFAVVQLVRGSISYETIGGPLIMAHMARVAADKGWDHFFHLMALISVTLAVFNLLPIPILDGGHLLFLAIESVIRRPVSIRIREITSLVGLALLLSLMVVAFRNDVVRLWLSKGS